MSSIIFADTKQSGQSGQTARKSGTASGLRSAAVTEWLNGGLARVGVGWRFSERLVRKLGHFSEYALLGFWLMALLGVLGG